MQTNELKNLVKLAQGERTQNQFALNSGLSSASITRICSGDYLPKPPILKKIAFHARGGVTYEKLMIAAGYLNDVAPANFSEHSGSVKIPILGRVVAGIPIDAVEEIVDYEDIPSEWIKDGREFFGLKVTGTSMYPKYIEGDTLIVRKQNTIDNNGQSCIVLINGNDATVKNLYISDKGITLQPINPSFEPLFFTKNDVDKLPVIILGVVVQIRREE